MTKRGSIALLTILTALTIAAGELPPGKWWRRAEIVQKLGLTDDQQTRLDAIFRSHANDLIDLRGNVEKQTIALRGELDQSQLNRQNIKNVAAKLNEARDRLFERELMMLIDMRAVLSDAQWNRMRSELESQGNGGAGRPAQQRKP